MKENPPKLESNHEAARGVEDFQRHRQRLMALAYRFLGSVSDAEDIVQETFLRWNASDRSAVANSEAFLVRVATRLCLDQLKSARARRETYVGTWLPEPLLQELDNVPSPATAAALADDVSTALLLALERLSPLERAAFLLHDVFGLEFDEVATAIQRTEAASRQLAVRARQRVRDARGRFSIEPAARDRIVQAFQAAVQQGNIARLAQTLLPDAVFYSDGGSMVRAARRPIVGRDRITRMLASLFKRKGPARWLRDAEINGMPGVVMEDAAGVLQTVAFETRDNGIAALYIVRNPKKLEHVRKHLQRLPKTTHQTTSYPWR